MDAISLWTGASGFSLLGLVLYWLLYSYIPTKDKQFKEFVERHDASLLTLTMKRDKQATDAYQDFRVDLKAISEHCEREMAGISGAMREQSGDMREAMSEVRDAIKLLEQGIRQDATDKADARRARKDAGGSKPDDARARRDG